MASRNKVAKTDKRNHWGRGRRFLKGTIKLKRVAFYNPSDRQKNKRVEAPDEERCCGNCNSFIDEDSEGLGWCTVYDWHTTCTMWCEEWEHKMDMPNVKLT